MPSFNPKIFLVSLILEVPPNYNEFFAIFFWDCIIKVAGLLFRVLFSGFIVVVYLLLLILSN